MPLRIAMVCWGLPLLIGSAVSIGVIATWGKHLDLAGGLVEIGVFDLLGGVALSVVGGIAILVFVAHRWAATAGERWVMTFRPAGLAVLLLASNYIVAFGMVWAVVTYLK